MEFRIKFIEGLGYFPQVKHGFLRPWKKIGAHPSGAYGLYEEKNIEYPHNTDREAIKTCRDYAQRLFLIKRTPYYTSVGIDKWDKS